MFKTIVVGNDGSPEAETAFTTAVELAERDDARLLVVHVQEFVGGKGGVYPLHVDEDDILVRIKDEIGKLNQRGIACDLQIDQIPFGGPAHMIADAARKADADLIVVGNKGRNPVSEIVLGNVPLRLLHIAHRPVLVVPTS